MEIKYIKECIYMRGRPKEHDNLKPLTLLVSADLIEKAKDLNINISEFVRESLSYAVKGQKKIDVIDQKKESEKKFEGIPKDIVKDMIYTSRRFPNYLEKVLKSVNEKYQTDVTKTDLEHIIEKY